MYINVDCPVDCPETEVNFCQTTTSSTTPCCWESMKKIPRTRVEHRFHLRKVVVISEVDGHGHGKMRRSTRGCSSKFMELIETWMWKKKIMENRYIYIYRLSANQIRLEFPISFAYKLLLISLRRWSKFEANKRIGWLWYVLIDMLW